MAWPLGLQKPGLSDRGVANVVTKFRMASGELSIPKECDRHLFVIIIIIIFFIFRNDLLVLILTYKFILYYFRRRLIIETKKKKSPVAPERGVSLKE